MKRYVIKHKIYFILGVMLVAFLTGGIFLRNDIVSHPAIRSHDWHMVTQNANFKARSGHTCVNYNGRLWIIGGWDGKNAHNDVWSSRDGIHWERAIHHAPFKPRAGHSTVVYNDRLWVIGGLCFDQNRNIDDLNDVWVTSDGKNWTRVTGNAPFSSRGGHSSIVFKNRLWVIGGIATSADIWTTRNGKEWNRVTNDAAFGSRGGHATVVFNKRIWVIGGIYVDDENNFHSLSDVWSSADGKKWEMAVDETSFFAGGGHSCVSFGDEIWVIGGFRKSGAIYRSKDGIHWDQFEEFGDFGERVSHSCVIFGNDIWIIGGYDGSGHKNDIWYFTDDKEEINISMVDKLEDETGNTGKN